MAEGPIRRACNRCHAQKLSCKRAGNEPCERCVRLKAECKSSPSLRFRKPGSTNSNTGGRPSNRHTISSHKDATTPNRPNFPLSHATDFTTVDVPYPGPYSFDGMAERLWPAHSVDAGLLIYRPDGNQIYQTLPPFQIPLVDGASNIFGDEYVAPPVDISPTSHSLAAMASGAMFPMPGTSPSPWVVGSPEFISGWDAESCSGVNIAHMPQRSYTGIDVPSTMSPAMEALYSSGHIDTDGTRDHVVHEHLQKYQGRQQDSAPTVSDVLFSELCTIRTRLLELGNLVPLALAHPTISLEPAHGVIGGSLFEAGVLLSREKTRFPDNNNNGRLSTRSSSSSFNKPPFPMDSLFALSQRFIEMMEAACHTDGIDLTSSRHDHGSTSSDHVMRDGPPVARTSVSGTSSTTGIRSERVDAANFVVLANSTYTALLNVYQGVLHLVHATANSVQTPSPSGTSDGSYGTDEAMKHSLRNACTASWKEATAQSCLNVCRFPDVSVGGFSIVSTAALQLGLGLRLADTFLVHFSHAVASLHRCFPGRGGVNVETMLGHALPPVGGAGSVSNAAMSTATTTEYSPLHPPLIFANDMYTSGGMDTSMVWDTATATSVSSSSTADLLFSPQDDSLSGMDDVPAREMQLRNALAALRSCLAC